MGRIRTPGGRLHVLFALLFILTNFASPAALSANEAQAERATVLATSFTCLYDPGNATLTENTMPPDCKPVPGVSISISSDLDGGQACTTGENGACEVTVTLGATVTAWQDTTLLSGTTARMNPIITIVGDYTELTFVNLPIATAVPTDVPPTSVPPTAVPPTEVPPTEVPPTEIPTEVPTQQPVVQRTSRTLQTTEQQESTSTVTATTTSTATSTSTVTATTTSTATSTSTATATSTSTATSTATATSTTPPTVTPTATKAPTQAPSPTPTKTPTKTPTPTPTPAPVTKTYATVSGTYGAGLRCRTEPNTSATIITVLAEGTKIETRGAASNGWIPVKCANQNGWIYAGYAKTTTETTNPAAPTPTQPPSTTVGTATVSNTAGAGLRCRASASTSASIITVLAEGTKVEIRGATSNGWIPVKCAGQNGWIYAAYATVNTTANPSPSPTPTPPPVSGTSGWGTVRNTGGGGLNCRAGAGTSFNVITILAEGSRVETRGAAVNGWVPVKCANQNGWVSSSYFVISTSGEAPKPTPTPTQAPSGGTGNYATVVGTGFGGLNCRAGAGTGYNVITILPEGTRVETRGSVSNGWLPVVCAGQNGWVSASYVLLGGSSGGGTGAVWIEVDLTRQYMRVYRGDTVIGETYVSTGRYGFDTPPGTFYINWKLPSQTMTGVLGGEYYYVQDVPWVMYFTDRGHAIHGAYWHNNFGYRMSHGCVNLPVPFAQWLYGITPVGTRVYIHY